MIVVTGATGQLGRQVVDTLLLTVPAADVGVSVRDAARASDLAARGVRVRAADFTDPGSLQHPFEGADQVLVISAAIRGEGAITANIAAIDAAAASGAHRVLYTSHQAASADSLFAPQVTHAATERHLLALGLPVTALRNGFYASSLAMQVGPALATGVLTAPADGPVSWTAHADLASAAVIALTREGALDGVTPALTSTEALDLEDIARLLSEITGRTIERQVVGDDEWVAQTIARGVPEAAATFAMGMYLASRRGEFAVTDPTLTELLGRPTTPVRSVLATLVA